MSERPIQKVVEGERKSQAGVISMVKSEASSKMSNEHCKSADADKIVKGFLNLCSLPILTTLSSNSNIGVLRKWS